MVTYSVLDIWNMNCSRLFCQTDDNSMENALITLQHRMEAISIAYVTAIAAKAGVNFSAKIAGDLPPDLYDYGTDGYFRKISVANGGRHRRSSIPLDYQLKATKNWKLKEGKSIKYEIEKKTYNDLVAQEEGLITSPIILILLCLPENFEDSVETTDTHLLMRKCAYWHKLSGDPILDTTGKEDNEGRTPIFIPCSQLFNAEILIDLLNKTATGELV